MALKKPNSNFHFFKFSFVVGNLILVGYKDHWFSGREKCIFLYIIMMMIFMVVNVAVLHNTNDIFALPSLLYDTYPLLQYMYFTSLVINNVRFCVWGHKEHIFFVARFWMWKRWCLMTIDHNIFCTAMNKNIDENMLDMKQTVFRYINNLVSYT